LADYIAILAAPGKLVAQGSPVALKSTLGEGYSLQINFGTVADEEKKVSMPATELLGSLRTIVPEASIISPSQTQAYYHLKTKDSATVEHVLRVLDNEKEKYAISSYEVHGTSIEDIFLRLMLEEKSEGIVANGSSNNPRILNLADGRQRSSIGQALTIFHKRLLVARRSWLSIILAIIIGVGGSTAPLFFMKGRVATCDLRFFSSTTTSLFLPDYSYPPGPSFAKSFGAILTSPPNVTSFLGTAIGSVPIQNVPDNATLVNYVTQNYQSLSPGGVSLDLQTNNSLIVWEGIPPGFVGPAMLNLLTNIQLNRALNSAPNNPSIIHLSYDPFPIINGEAADALKWVSFFGLAMAVFPAFFSVYVSRERRSSVQAMQFSNGLSNPVGLWLGHLMFDSIVVVILATVNIIVFGTVSTQFHDFGLLVCSQTHLSDRLNSFPASVI
jgi:ATP-binding cassette, subfamily A (ABC1), member 3